MIIKKKRLEWTKKAEAADVLAVWQAAIAIFWPILGFKEFFK